MQNIEKQIKNGKLETNVFLIYGTERYLINRLEKKLSEFVTKGDAFADMNKTTLEGKEVTAEAVMDAAQPLPFMADKRFVAVKDAGFFKPGKKEQSEKLKEYLPLIPEHTVMLFIDDEADARSSAYKALAKTGFAQKFNNLGENELVAWLTAYFKSRGVFIGKKEALLMLRRVGDGMFALSSEADKLSDYVGEGGSINAQIIDELCAKSAEAQIFDLTNALGRKDVSAAFSVYENLLADGKEPLLILSMLSRQFSNALKCKALAEEGESNANIAAALNFKKASAVGFLIKQGTYFKKSALIAAMKECLETELDIKTGLIAPELAVELLITKYSS